MFWAQMIVMITLVVSLTLHWRTAAEKCDNTAAGYAMFTGILIVCLFFAGALNKIFGWPL